MAGLGWRQWVRERLPADLFQGYIQDQVTSVWSSRAARTAGIPAPSDGMFSYLLDERRHEVRQGGAWKPADPTVAAILLGSSADTTTLPSGVWTPLPITGVEELDTHGGHSTTVTPSRWTCPAGEEGLYMVTTGTRIDTNVGVRSCSVRKNGTEIIQRAQQSIPTSVSQAIVVTSTPIVVSLTGGEYVEAIAFQNSGNNTLTATGTWHHMTVLRLARL